MDAEQEPLALVGQIIEGLEPGGFVTRYVLVAEVISGDGQRNVWSQTGGDIEPWDVLGLLTHEVEDRKAEHLIAVMDQT